MKQKTDLIIGKKTKQKLNPKQRTFNRLIKKLEKLRVEKDKTTAELNEKLNYYGKHISPLELNIAALHKESAKIFHKFYREKKSFSESDNDILIGMMATQLNEFSKFGSEEPDDELKEIFELIEGESFDEAAESDFQAMKEDMSETFKEMGFDIDLDDFNSDLSEEEMMRKMFEMLGDAKDQAEAKAAAEPKRKKTKKQIEKEEREKQIEEAKNKSIAGVYKSLAKVFHPDLERDAERRLEKEALMKQLTAAYKNNDLHTLLRLELEWLHKEESDLDKLSDEKLEIYNRALKEQTEELEAEIYITVQHPRYFPLQKYARFFGIEGVNLKQEKKNLEAKIKWMAADIEELKGKSSLKKLKEIIRTAKKQLKKQNIFTISLDDLFNL